MPNINPKLREAHSTSKSKKYSKPDRAYKMFIIGPILQTWKENV